METFNINVKHHLSFLDNEQIYAAILIALTLYSGFAPKLPKQIVNLLNHTLVKLIIFFLIICISIKNVTLAIVATIAIFVAFNTMCCNKLNNEMMSVINGTQHGTKCQCNQCTCSNDDQDHVQYHGQEAIPNNGDIVWINENDHEQDSEIHEVLGEDHVVQEILEHKAEIEEKIQRPLTKQELKTLSSQIANNNMISGHDSESHDSESHDNESHDNESHDIENELVKHNSNALPGYNESNFAQV
jgi:hypothetical protein